MVTDMRVQANALDSHGLLQITQDLWTGTSAHGGCVYCVVCVVLCLAWLGWICSLLCVALGVCTTFASENKGPSSVLL